MIPFNKPFIVGNELKYIEEAVISGKISGDGIFTKKCHEFFESKYEFQKVLMTTSCTDALEMAALLIDIQPGDEVIIPSYTFVSTANAFALRGAKIIFADSYSDDPNLDADHLEQYITPKTRAIIPVHYAGVACDMDKIMDLAEKHNLYVIEDAAQAIDSYYTDRNGQKRILGSIGHFAAFSFHETKNIISGEGGLLAINDARFNERAEIIREKGTNRSAFFRGEVNKYGWVDLGSSFLPSELISAFLYAQLEKIEEIQKKRKELWQYYYDSLSAIAEKLKFKLPKIPSYATNNGHMFYLVFENIQDRTAFINKCRENEVFPVFHYLSLHKSEFYTVNNPDNRFECPNSDKFTDTLLRLPMYYNLENKDIDRIVEIFSSQA